MVKAGELITNQKKREKNKYKTFSKIYKLIEKKIILASASNFYYIWYEIPEFIVGLPLYNLAECKTFVVKVLKDNDFKVEEYGTNIILIKWFPK